MSVNDGNKSHLSTPTQNHVGIIALPQIGNTLAKVGRAAAAFCFNLGRGFHHVTGVMIAITRTVRVWVAEQCGATQDEMVRKH